MCLSVVNDTRMNLCFNGPVPFPMIYTYKRIRCAHNMQTCLTNLKCVAITLHIKLVCVVNIHTSFNRTFMYYLPPGGTSLKLDTLRP